MAKRPPIVKPWAPKKIVRNRKPAGPARTASTVVTGQRCENAPCARAAIVFRLGRWWCRTCDKGPAPDPACTHSLASVFDGIMRCSYCGGDLKEASYGTA